MYILFVLVQVQARADRSTVSIIFKKSGLWKPNLQLQQHFLISRNWKCISFDPLMLTCLRFPSAPILHSPQTSECNVFSQAHGGTGQGLA